MTTGKRALAIGLALLWTSAACSRPPKTAQDVIERSVRAHGGDRLTNWQTLTITGTVDMQDGITYRAAYRLLAKTPGKVRVDQDLTADRGRLFYEYFLNDGVAWNRRNLIPGRADVKRLTRWLNQCYGIAYYARHATAFELRPEGTVAWQVPVEPGSTTLRVVESRPAYIVRATVDGVSVDLFIDRESFYFLQEVRPDGRRVYRDFKDFGGVVMPTKVNDFAASRQGETLTPFTYEAVKYNEPIDDGLFEEDRPVK